MRKEQTGKQINLTLKNQADNEELKLKSNKLPYHLLVSSKLADLKAKRKRELIYKKCFCCKTKEVLLKT